DLLNCFALSVSQFLDVLFLCRNELMKRRIKETDRYRVAFKSLIQLLEISLLLRKDLIKSCLSLFLCLRADHLAECIDSVALEEHMLCTAQTDSLSTQLTSLLSVCRCIGICADLHCSVLVSPAHDASELACDRSVYCRNDSVINITCRSVDRDRVSLVELFSCECKFLICFIHND